MHRKNDTVAQPIADHFIFLEIVIYWYQTIFLVYLAMTTLNILKEPIYDVFFFGLIIVYRCPQTVNFKSFFGPKFNEPHYVLITATRLSTMRTGFGEMFLCHVKDLYLPSFFMRNTSQLILGRQSPDITNQKYYQIGIRPNRFFTLPKHYLWH